MAFITDDDYKLVIGTQALQTISQVDANVRTMAEKEAVEELSGYLRGRYDIETIFAKTGDDRNAVLVMYACDIALYHMSASVPQRLGAQVREERYNRALEWLQKVATGIVTPDLPIDDEAAEKTAPFVIHSERKLNNAW